MATYLCIKVPESINVDDDLRGGIFAMVSKTGFRVISICQDVFIVKSDCLNEQASAKCEALTLAESINVAREAGRLLEVQSLLGHLGAVSRTRIVRPGGM